MNIVLLPYFQPVEHNIADHALMFMVTGITSNIRGNIAYYGTRTAASADALWNYMWECVDYLETTCMLKVSN